ncbi:MAG: restriction endonuclease subunit S [Lachnospiraceae bacterium]|nr:restriction endonuclease subunit S [Bacteroides sp.]MBD5505645.1 restriction endonuclease subunit S [Lachnospiraceae bacterium]
MKTVKLQDITLNITDGKHGDCESEDNSGYYFVSCKDVRDGNICYENARQITERAFVETHNRTLLEPNDILITNSGTIGRMALVKDIPETYKTTFQKSVAIVKPNQDLMRPDYLYYSLLNCVQQFVNESNGSAQKNLLLGTMRNFDIVIEESFEKQEKLAGILKAYDDLIENNQKQIKLLEEAAQRLYKEWFVDLRFPNYEECKIIGGVPEGWKRLLISDVCETIGGGTPATKVNEYYQDGEIRWVTPTDITKNKSIILLDSEKKITKLGLERSAARMVPPYTILMTSRASVGYFGICEHEVCTNQGFISCVPFEENVRYFLLYNLMYRVEEIRQKASGSTFLEISKKSFRELEIVLPDSNTLEMFNKVIPPLIKQIEISVKRMSQLSQARDRLLPKLMNGEIKM